jgi:nitrate reductase gamma subunit
MKAALLFAGLPYAAAGILAFGVCIRCVAAWRRHRAGAGDRPEGAPLIDDNKLLWASILFTLAAHAAGLLFPQSIIRWNQEAIRLYASECLAFALGIGALAGWSVDFLRRLSHSQNSQADRLADECFFSVLLLTLLTGLLTAALYRWGSSWSALTLTPYIRSLLGTAPSVALAAEMPFLVRVHICSAFGVILLLPFTRLFHRLCSFVIAEIRTALRPATDRLAQAWRPVAVVIDLLNLPGRIWPEED